LFVVDLSLWVYGLLIRLKGVACFKLRTQVYGVLWVIGVLSLGLMSVSTNWFRGQ